MKTKKILLLAMVFCMFILAISSCSTSHKHTWIDADCTHPKTCSECGATEGDPLGHKDEAVAGKEATCTEDGLTDGKKCSVCGAVTEEQKTIDSLGHKDEDEDHKCDRCGTTLCTEHIPQEAVKENEVAATCTNGGSYESVVYCSICGEEISREAKTTEKLGHNYNDGVETKAPTCTDKGIKTYTCLRDGCGHSYTEDIETLGHDKISHEAKKPTCTDAGWDAYETCSRCSYSTKVEKPSTGHKDKYICNNDGTHTLACENCSFKGETTECELTTVSDTEPVFGTAGKLVMQCEKCGYTLNKSYTTLSYKLGSTSINDKKFTATSSNFGDDAATLLKGKVIYLGERVFSPDSQFVLSADVALSNQGTDNWIQFEIQDGTQKLLIGINVTFVENDLFNLRIAGTQTDGTTLGNKYIADASFLYDKTTKETYTTVPAWSSALAKKIASEDTTLNLALQRELAVGLDGTSTVAMYTVFVNGQKLISFYESTSQKTIALGGSNASDTVKYDFTMGDFIVGISTVNVDAELTDITIDTDFEKTSANIVNESYSLTDGTVSSTASSNPSVSDSVLVNSGKESYLGNLKLDHDAEFELTATAVLTNTNGKGFGFTIHNGTTKMDFMLMCGNTDGYYRTRVRVNGTGFYYVDDNYVYGNGTDTCPTSQWNSSYYFKDTDLSAENGITLTLKREAATYRDVETYKYSIIIGGKTVAYWYQNTSGNVQYTVNGSNKEAKSIDVTMSNEFAVGFITDGVAVRFNDIIFNS